MGEKSTSSFGIFSFNKMLWREQITDYGRLLWWIVAQPQQVQTHLVQANVAQRQQLMRLGNWCLGVIIWLPLWVATAVLWLSNMSPFTSGGTLLLLRSFGLAIGLTGWNEQLAHALSSNAVVQVSLTAVLAVATFSITFLSATGLDLPAVSLALLGLLLSTMAVAVLATFLFWMTGKPLLLVTAAGLITLIGLLFSTAPFHLLFLVLVFCAAILTTCLSQRHQQALFPPTGL